MGLYHPGIASLAWWQARTSVRMRIVLLLALVPLAAGILGIVGEGVRAQNLRERGLDPVDNFDPDLVEAVTWLVLYSALPLTALLMAGGLVADDVEDRTLSYLLVRPVRRAQLYFSKLVPVALATGILGALQALSLAACRLVAWGLYGQGARSPVSGSGLSSGPFVVADPPATVDAGAAILTAALGAVLAAFLLGVALAAIFGCMSLLVPRFHFLANVLVYAAIEVPFSFLGPLGLGFLTPTTHAVALMGGFDLTRRNAVVSELGTAGVVLAAPIIAALIAAWVWIAVRRVRTRDFNITSATG